MPALFVFTEHALTLTRWGHNLDRSIFSPSPTLDIFCILSNLTHKPMTYLHNLVR